MLAIAYERASRHWSQSARRYQAFAQTETSPDCQTILQALNDRARQRAADYNQRLKMLHADSLYERDAWHSRLWRWLLLRMGAKAAMTWLVWDEKKYMRLPGLSASPRRHR